MFARVRILLFRLLDPDRAEDAARMLRGMDGPGVVEGLCLLAERAASPAAQGSRREEAAGVAAVRGLAMRDGPRAREAIGAALAAAAPASVRLEAALALDARPDAAVAEDLVRCLEEDPAPIVRRAALYALARLGAPHGTAIVAALGDPVWRLRRHAVERIEAPPPRGLGLTPGAPIERLLRDALAARAPLDATTCGALELLARRTGVRLRDAPDHAPPPTTRPPWWNDDPGVLLASLRHVEASACTGVGLVDLLAFEDSRPYNEHAGHLRAFAAEALERTASAGELVAVAALLGEPRRPFVRGEVESFLARLSPQRRAELAAHVLAAAGVPPAAIAWAVAWATAAPSAALHAHPAAIVRAAAVQRSARLGAPASALLSALDDADDRVRLVALAALDGVPLDPARTRTLAGGGPGWRGALARHRILHGDHAERGAAVAEALADVDARVRAAAALALATVDPGSPALALWAADGDDRVRAAALTEATAAALWRAPDAEPSIRVLARAAELLGRPVAALAPVSTVDLRAPQDPFGVEPTDSPYLSNRPSIDARERVWAARRAQHPGPAGTVPPSHPPLVAPDRPLGTTGLRLPPLAISGRYGLPEEAFDEALERGVRLFFWEPTYEGQTRWVRRIAPARRAGLTFLAGTFEADPRAIRRDAEAALRLLRVEVLDVFLVFWARSPERLGEDVLETLSRLVEAGRLRTFGLSTHRRDLAARAVAQGWPVVMVRHSAAHRGAEVEVFPAALAAGAGVLTFSNLCYGRMLRPGFGPNPPVRDGGSPGPGPSSAPNHPAPADCYRYSLAQPGVTTAISGPRDVLQLRENLRVLESPDLPAERLAGLRAFGDRVHADNREFFELVRWR